MKKINWCAVQFYTSFLCSCIAIAGFSALMFLVPFVVDPTLGECPCHIK
jgi:hypothetical protein